MRCANKCSVMLKDPLNPQLAVIVNKVTLHGAFREAKIWYNSPFSIRNTIWAQHAIESVFISSTVIPPWDINTRHSIEALFIFFTLIDKCGKLLCLLQWAQ